MPVPDPTPRRPETPRRRRWKWLLPLAFFPATLLALSWYFTEPLTDHVAPVPASPRDRTKPGEGIGAVPDQPVVWPDAKLEGDEAKKLLLASMKRTVARLERVEAYTATFRRQERVAGVLGPEQVAALKIRNQPFAIYLKFLAPKAGREVVYAEGHHDNNLIVHNGDWTRRLIPRLAFRPDSGLALADSRHPVTEAGLLNLSRKLFHFRNLDMNDADATTTLERITSPDGRTSLRSFHTHARPNAGRPFCQVEVLYDPVSQIPFQITSYDWPGPDHSGELNLAERYTYDDIKFDAPLTATDFDPRNPDYAFMRF